MNKTSHNAFTTASLDQELRRRSVTRLRIRGIRNEQCVETSARLLTRSRRAGSGSPNWT